MKYYAYISLLIFYSCLTGNNHIIDTAKVGDNTFNLVQYGKSVELQLSNKNFEIKGEFELKPPCYFVRKNNSLLSYSYEDVNVDGVIIVIGNISSNDMKSKYDISENELCGDKAQGIIIKENLVTISNLVLDGGITCANTGLDEKVFWDFAHK